MNGPVGAGSQLDSFSFDAGLLAYRELDDALGLSAMAGKMLADARTGKNGGHALVVCRGSQCLVVSPDMRT